MDNDQRDRRDWPAPDPSDDAGEPTAGGDAGEPTEDAGEGTRPAGEEAALGDQGESPAEATPPPAPDWGATEPPQPPEDRTDEAAAEMESAPAAAGDQPDAVTADESRPWPTEPPSAGSGGPDVWPTSAPERSDSDDVPSADEGEPEPVEPVMATGTEPTWPSEDAAAVEAAPAEPDWARPAADEPSSEPPPSEVESYSASAPAEPTLDAGEAAAVAAAGAAAHSVPDAEAAIGESTKCPRCGTENQPGLAFCRNCGQRLVAAGVATTVERPGTPDGTVACPRCGTHNRAGVAFCQNCGANLRGTGAGYVPPAVAGAEGTAPATRERAGAVLGPIVLLIGLVGLVTGYLLPFLYGEGSLFDRAFGAGGYGGAFWSGYPEVEANLADQAYFGLAGPLPLLGLLLLVLAVAGFVRARPGSLQTLGLVIALIWTVGLAVLFLLVEVAGNWDGDMVGLLRVLTPAGIIFFLASLIVLIGTLTRFGRS